MHAADRAPRPPPPAAAFGAHLELHQPTVERMQEHYDRRGVELNQARLRMAMLPKDGEGPRWRCAHAPRVPPPAAHAPVGLHAQPAS